MKKESKKQITKKKCEWCDDGKSRNVELECRECGAQYCAECTNGECLNCPPPVLYKIEEEKLRK